MSTVGYVGAGAALGVVAAVILQQMDRRGGIKPETVALMGAVGAGAGYLYHGAMGTPAPPAPPAVLAAPPSVTFGPATQGIRVGRVGR